MMCPIEGNSLIPEPQVQPCTSHWNTEEVAGWCVDLALSSFVLYEMNMTEIKAVY